MRLLILFSFGMLLMGVSFALPGPKITQSEEVPEPVFTVEQINTKETYYYDSTVYVPSMIHHEILAEAFNYHYASKDFGTPVVGVINKTPYRVEVNVPFYPSQALLFNINKHEPGFNAFDNNGGYSLGNLYERWRYGQGYHKIELKATVLPSDSVKDAGFHYFGVNFVHAKSVTTQEGGNRLSEANEDAYVLHTPLINDSYFSQNYEIYPYVAFPKKQESLRVQDSRNESFMVRAYPHGEGVSSEALFTKKLVPRNNNDFELKDGNELFVDIYTKEVELPVIYTEDEYVHYGRWLYSSLDWAKLKAVPADEDILRDNNFSMTVYLIEVSYREGEKLQDSGGTDSPVADNHEQEAQLTDEPEVSTSDKPEDTYGYVPQQEL